MSTLSVVDIRKNIIDIKLKLDMVEENTRQALDALYQMEEKMFDQEEADYARRYFLAGV